MTMQVRHLCCRSYFFLGAAAASPLFSF